MTTTYVGVCGAGVASGELAALAEEVGRRLAEAQAVVVCGGGGGVMEAVSRGAESAGGTTVGLLPGGERAAGNEHLTVVIPTGLGEMRNALIVRASDVIVAIGGEWGTLSEIAFGRRLGRTVATLGSWRPQGAGPMADAPGVEEAGDAVEAVRIALEAAG